MQKVSCPSCGAAVQFRSAASVLAVCEYCKTTLLKDADSVRDLGKMSEVLDDYSPLQIGTSGRFGNSNFSVIGRIQLRYSAGMWNEWYILFDDGMPAWLSDSSGLYTLTKELRGAQNLPAFTQIIPSHSYLIDNKNFIASEVRSAQCTGGQGELPFKVGQGWRAYVADFRCDTSFMTLDYSDLIADANAPIPYTGTPDEAVVLDAGQPKVYIGQAVKLSQLKCQLLRDDDTIKDSAGKYRGKIGRLDCPKCGSNISYLPGLTQTLVCPSCHSQVDASSKTAEVLAAGNRMAQIQTTLELGASANIFGKPYELIGLMRRSDEENTLWTEYLLYNAQAGFLWLIETDEGWARAKVQDDWPRWSEGAAMLGNRTFSKLYDYTAQVVFAAGAFNWRVNVGDKTDVLEFQNGESRLAAEITDQEITWSLSTSVPADQIRAWFGEDIKANKKGPEVKLKDQARNFIFWMLVANAIPLLFAFESTWVWVALAVAAIHFPAKYLSDV